MSWFQKAANAGLGSAQYNIALIYEHGLGVSEDLLKAAIWYQLAAAQEVGPALVNLGKMFEKGQGVKQDYAEAAACYRKAALQGYALAQYNLGVLYANGYGVPKDDIRAYMWFTMAVKFSRFGQEWAQAIAALDYFKGTLTASEIALAEQRARDLSRQQR